MVFPLVWQIAKKDMIIEKSKKTFDVKKRKVIMDFKKISKSEGN